MAPCEDCGGFLPEGCTCAFESSDSVLLTPSSSSLSTLLPSARIDPNPDNIIEDSTGLRTTPNSLFIDKPAAAIIRTTNFSLNVLTTAYTDLAFTGTLYETHAGMVVSDAIFCVEDGWHHAGFFCEILPNSVGVAYTVALLLNGERELAQIQGRFIDNQNEGAWINLTTEVFMEEGDYIQVSVWAHVDVVGNVIILGSPNPHFYLHWNRPPE